MGEKKGGRLQGEETAKCGGLTPEILALRGLKHEGCWEFKAIQSYIDFWREG